MKIAIISDSHDNLPNLEKALSWIKSQNISLIIHCGDLCAPTMLSKVLAPNFSGEIHFVYGNVGDRERLQDIIKPFKNVKFYGDVGEIELDGNPEGEPRTRTSTVRGRQAPYGARKIAFCHFPEKAKELAVTQRHDLVFYGHTHKPWEEKIGRTRLVNPGNLAGLFYKATFAVYDTETDKLELKILEKL